MQVQGIIAMQNLSRTRKPALPGYWLRRRVSGTSLLQKLALKGGALTSLMVTALALRVQKVRGYLQPDVIAIVQERHDGH